MADDKGGGHDAMKDVYFFITFLVIVVILWFAAGGPGRADVRGAFLHAPPPLDSGTSYDPYAGQTQQNFQTGSVQPPPPVQY